jgi:hypothetical protein
MATTYPPQIPPATRTDNTIAAGNHADDHNKASLALKAILDILGNAPAGNAISLTARLAALTPRPEDLVVTLPPPSGGDDSAMLATAFAAGGIITTRPGVYLVTTPPVISAPTALMLHDLTTIKFADGAANGAGLRSPLRIASSYVSITGGTIDANRNGQDKAAFNAANGSAGGRYLFGLHVSGTLANPLKGVVVDTTIINVVDSALYAYAVDESELTVYTRNCANTAAVYYSKATNVKVTGRTVDHDGWKVFPHAFDLIGCKAIDLDINITDHHYSTGGLSAWGSGFTCIDSDEVTIRGLRMASRDDATMLPGVGTSFLNCRRLRLLGGEISGYSDVHMELGGVIDCQFANTTIDGHYRGAATAAIGRGIACYNNGFLGDFSTRVTRFTDACQFVNILITRCLGNGIDLWMARNTKWVNVRSNGNLVGLRSRRTLVDDGGLVAQPIVTDISGHRFISCDFSWNENAGVEAYDLSRASFVSCTWANNGQAKTMGATRRGVVGADTTTSGFKAGTSTAGLTKTDLEFLSCHGIDTQGFTGAVTVNPATPQVLGVSDESHYAVGQVIRLIGAGAAGVDLLARVDDFTADQLTIDRALSTFPTVAGTGTISTTGKAIVGAGTAFTTELDARYWLTAAGNTRRVNKIADATHATLEAAFPADLPAGTTFTLYKVVTNGVPSQMSGSSFTVDCINPRMIGGSMQGSTGTVVDGTATATRLRMMGVVGQITRFTNTVASGGNLVSGADSGFETSVGTVGPGSEPAVKLGGDTMIYRVNAKRVAVPADHTIQGGRMTTATRPTPAAAGAGASLYDTTLNKPVWSDGTNWRDSAGTIV